MIKRSLIMGSGRCATDIAHALLAEDIEVIIAKNDGDDNPSLHPLLEGLEGVSAEFLTNTQVLSCDGCVGDFHISMKTDGEKTSRTVSNVIIAEENMRVPNFSRYGLTASSNILALSAVKSFNSNGADFFKEKKVVFLSGLKKESHPVILEDIMRSCLRLQTEFNAKTYLLTKNLKVGGRDLESLYRETKQAGTVYVKFTQDLPHISQDDEGSVTIEFTDEITRQRFRLSPDITVVDETVSPSVITENLAGVFRLDRDGDGFLQTRNVHRVSVYSNRKGILVAGPSRGARHPDDYKKDAASASLETISLVRKDITEQEDYAEINPEGCIHCLTCYRLCPHSAIRLTRTLSVMPAACEGCGICAAECPRHKITMIGPKYSHVTDGLAEPDHLNTEKPEATSFTPSIVAFCCSRSAEPAGILASEMGQSLPGGLRIMKVPCAGNVSLDHIFSALTKNADGVVVLTCHEGNCQSEKGNLHAMKRVDHIRGLLSELGLEKERVTIKTLASNMGKEFSVVVQEFEDKIRNLGPNRVKQGN